MLYYGNASKNYTSNVNVGNKTSYQLTGLKDGSTYYFAVKAYNTGQSVESVLSNEVSVTIPAFTTNFSANKTSGTAPLIVTFTPAENAQVTAWKWDYGTAAIPSSTAKISTVTFSTPGTYSVKLTVTGLGGVTATATKSITVSAAPSPTKPPVQPPTPRRLHVCPAPALQVWLQHIVLKK